VSHICTDKYYKKNITQIKFGLDQAISSICLL